MRSFFFLLLFMFFFLFGYSQEHNFPQSWVGNWKGELYWYKGNMTAPKKVDMELRIKPADSADRYTWQLIYGSESKDNRPYTLLAKDTVKGHWVIDEHNGIVLDQFWVAGKLCGAFTVGNATIMNTYRKENDKIKVEFYTISAKPIAVTGKGTDDSPSVDSYKVTAFQEAVLIKQ